jgi:Glyoxalase/Bleomycin resistance protein/Dioxygenase superfamily
METSPVRHADLFHTGIVVDDLTSAKEEFGDLLGVTWLEGEGDSPMLLADGPRTLRMAFAYSAAGPHHLELIQSVPGTLWTVAGTGHAHHVGYWSDDVGQASAALSARGLPRVANLGTYEDDQFPIGVYHQGNNGLYIEVLSRELYPVIFGAQA